MGVYNIFLGFTVTSCRESAYANSQELVHDLLITSSIVRRSGAGAWKCWNEVRNLFNPVKEKTKPRCATPLSFLRENEQAGNRLVGPVRCQHPRSLLHATFPIRPVRDDMSDWVLRGVSVTLGFVNIFVVLHRSRSCALGTIPSCPWLKMSPLVLSFLLSLFFQRFSPCLFFSLVLSFFVYSIILTTFALRTSLFLTGRKFVPRPKFNCKICCAPFSTCHSTCRSATSRVLYRRGLKIS